MSLLTLKLALKKYVKNEIKIKYPNDLYINGKKISGILNEIIFFNKKRFLVIGIGVNISNNPIIENYPTANLNQFSDKKISKFSILNNIKNTYKYKY